MARFSDQFIDDVRNAIRCSDIVGKQVRLKHTSGHEHSGLCPFHKEKSPSFTVSDDKGFYHCFGCGAHGDIIKFVMETDGLRYPEAIEKLAEYAGLELPKTQSTPQQQSGPSPYDIMHLANEFFKKQLTSNHDAKHYLEQRKVTSNLIEKFQVGYAPNDFHALHKHLTQHHITESMMLDVGLLTKNDKGNIYDRFRNRIIFPILHRNKIVAFGGRILGDGKPKYLNSPETSIFKKGHILYSNPSAQKESYTHKSIIVTEGYMDTIALSKANIHHVVAPLGTAITQHHLQLLWNMAPEPILCLDGDNAGQAAMAKAIDLALPHLKPGYSLRFAILPKGLDPDDLINQQGPESIKQCLDQAIPLAHALWNLEYKSKNITTPEQWASLEQKLDERTNSILDKSVQYRYKDFFKQNCWQYSKQIRKNIHKNTKKNSLSNELSELVKNNTHTPLENSYETILLTIIIDHPELLEKNEILDEFMHIDASLFFFTALRESILEAFYDAEANETPLSKTQLLEHLKKDRLTEHVKALEKNSHIQLNQTIDLPTDDNTSAIKNWEHTIKLYRLIKMEGEFKLMVSNIEGNATENSLNQALALQKEIAELKKTLDIN